MGNRREDRHILAKDWSFKMKSRLLVLVGLVLAGWLTAGNAQAFGRRNGGDCDASAFPVPSPDNHRHAHGANRQQAERLARFLLAVAQDRVRSTFDRSGKPYGPEWL